MKVYGQPSGIEMVTLEIYISSKGSLCSSLQSVVTVLASYFRHMIQRSKEAKKSCSARCIVI